jgi:predicted O-methyltransferase YrrM
LINFKAKSYKVRKILANFIAPLPPFSLVSTIPQQQIPKISNRTYELIIDAIKGSNQNPLNGLAKNLPLESDRIVFDEWPGEHYRFLHEFTKITKPNLTIEIGTFRGSSALALAPYSKRIITYDVIPLNQIQDSYQNLMNDFPNVEQRIGDLQNLDYWSKESHQFQDADLVFIDGPKNVFFERDVIPRVISTMKKGSYLVLDDIRFNNMSEIWSSLGKPRIDIGCFAHLSGTGFVEI